jgi:hypothetical protein
LDSGDGGGSTTTGTGSTSEEVVEPPTTPKPNSNIIKGQVVFSISGKTSKYQPDAGWGGASTMANGENFYASVRDRSKPYPIAIPYRLAEALADKLGISYSDLIGRNGTKNQPRFYIKVESGVNEGKIFEVRVNNVGGRPATSRGREVVGLFNNTNFREVVNKNFGTDNIATSDKGTNQRIVDVPVPLVKTLGLPHNTDITLIVAKR